MDKLYWANDAEFNLESRKFMEHYGSSTDEEIWRIWDNYKRKKLHLSNPVTPIKLQSKGEPLKGGLASLLNIVYSSTTFRDPEEKIGILNFLGNRVTIDIAVEKVLITLLKCSNNIDSDAGLECFETFSDIIKFYLSSNKYMSAKSLLEYFRSMKETVDQVYYATVIADVFIEKLGEYTENESI